MTGLPFNSRTGHQLHIRPLAWLSHSGDFIFSRKRFCPLTVHYLPFPVLRVSLRAFSVLVFLIFLVLVKVEYRSNCVRYFRLCLLEYMAVY